MATSTSQLRGQYKVPGGKLVAVRLATAADQIVAVQVSGDFFAEPETVTGRIETALTGSSVTESAASLARRIGAALEPGDTLVGFDADAVAIAVRRALDGGIVPRSPGSSTWSDYNFELIEDGPQSPVMHMALDQVFAEELAAGRRGPTLRFWQWAASAVVIGVHQSWCDEVDHEAAARHGVDVVRRVTGGGAMFIEPGNTITYSLVVPESLVDGMSVIDSYAFLDAWCVAALRQLGVNASHQPINDIASPAGKIAGAAQKRFAGGAVLHHVTMAYNIDAVKMLDVLRIGREKLSDRGTKSAAKRVDPLRSQTGLPKDAVVSALQDHFAALYNLAPAEPRAAELARARYLAQTIFATEAWLQRVP